MNISSFEEARELFPMVKSCVYLDSAHYAPYSTETRKRLFDFINKFTETNYNLSIFNNEIPINANLANLEKGKTPKFLHLFKSLFAFSNISKGDFISLATIRFAFNDLIALRS